jgi:transcriptional regulator of arginine metabolism
MKNSRQEAILRIIASNSVETQDALLELLQQEGYRATQATISRDIRDLQLVKTMTARGTYRYQVSSRQDPVIPKFNSALTESIIRVESANNIIVIHTYAGMAQAVAACLDSMKMVDVLGCVAGDDTIIIIAKDNHAAVNLSMNLRSMIQTL